MFGVKKSLDLGIIIGENGHRFLSLDEYAEHFLLPFSPRFRNIDFAVSTLSTLGISNIIILTKRDKEILNNYLIKGWPLINFYFFDYDEAKELFSKFLEEYTQEHRLEQLIIIKGSYPVWFDLRQIKPELEKASSIAVKTRVGKESVISTLAVEKSLFIKKYEEILFSEDSLEKDVLQALTDEFKIHTMDAQGFIMPFRSLKEYYDVHMNMLEDYLVYDRFNAYVPIRSNMAMVLSSTLGKGSYVKNSIVGENVEILGQVENSVIFSNVKIAKHAVVRDSIILPGNNIASHAKVTRCIIDEFAGDNTLPSVESNAEIGSETPASQPNEKYPDDLNFGVTLIGKDVRIPGHLKIGANCFIDSFYPFNDLKRMRKIEDGTALLHEHPEIQQAIVQEKTEPKETI